MTQIIPCDPYWPMYGNKIWAGTKPHIFWCVTWLITLVFTCSDYVLIILANSILLPPALTSRLKILRQLISNAAPHLWNNLPPSLRSYSSCNSTFSNVVRQSWHCKCKLIIEIEKDIYLLPGNPKFHWSHLVFRFYE